MTVIPRISLRLDAIGKIGMIIAETALFRLFYEYATDFTGMIVVVAVTSNLIPCSNSLGITRRMGL